MVGARDPGRGRAAAERLGARFVCIDVALDASVARAAEDVLAQEGRVDLIINNAGIIGSHASADELAGPDATELLDTNVAGIVQVTHAFLPLLRRSAHPGVIDVSSGMGSFAITHDPDRVESRPVAPLDTASRAAVTMLTTQHAKALPGIRVSAAGPTAPPPDLNGRTGPQTLTEGTEAIVALATEGPDGGTGRSWIATAPCAGSRRPPYSPLVPDASTAGRTPCAGS
ncbi:SDR family NAD(P)-dependent oxidoreductase [Baekduia soli]|uniref:SDR family NAD(P)-dependent oxidoreductase n=1 Tax=Baekduia soli TaxID=496014 RepID=UPI003898E8EA